MNPAPNGPQGFTFTGVDDITAPASLTFECRIDGGAYAPCTSPTTLNGLTAASHTFDVRAKDAAGNLDPTPATYTWTVNARLLRRRIGHRRIRSGQLGAVLVDEQQRHRLLGEGGLQVG